MKKNCARATKQEEEMKKQEKIEIRELTLDHGLSYPSDEELIMLILGSGTKQQPIEQLAKKVLNSVLASNENDLVQNLIKIAGMGKTKALKIAASLEFGRRMNRNPQVVLDKPKDIVPYIKNYAVQPVEHFLCISMTGGREILSIRVICVGSGNMAVLKTAEVFCEAVKEHASAIIISHNHPGGNPMPSDSDIRTTKRLLHASEILGIALVDHIIITRTSYFSFLEHNLLV